jgi:hypothetical protein
VIYYSNVLFLSLSVLNFFTFFISSIDIDQYIKVPEETSNSMSAYFYVSCFQYVNFMLALIKVIL